jgi:hypothetical protein
MRAQLKGNEEFFDDKNFYNQIYRHLVLLDDNGLQGVADISMPTCCG